MRQVIAGAEIFDGASWLTGHALVIEDGVITELLPAERAQGEEHRLDLDGGILAPGFIDLQVNGGGGILFNQQPDADALTLLFQAHRSRGTTALVPTIITDTKERQAAAVACVRRALAQGMEGLLGIHLEGPHFNPQRRGVHRADLLCPLSGPACDWLLSQADVPLILTLAPEQTLAGQISTLTAAGVRVNAGHTQASHEQVQQALAEGMRGFTHLFNAMAPLTARQPGVIAAALGDTSSWCSIICDGHHVHPANVLLAQRAKTPGKLYLVSDAMATVGSPHKFFQLYGETIVEEDGKLLTGEGKLAGSAIGMIDAVHIATEQVGLPLTESLRMASLYPAQYMGLEARRGRLSPGYRADLVHFDTHYRVHATWVNGEHCGH